MPTPPVAVVIPSWNTRDDLDRCLHSLEPARDLLEVFVVDNGSTDGSIELLAEEAVPHIALRDNQGFGSAVNLGVARTAAPFVFVLNADAFVEHGCVELLLAALRPDPTLGGVQPKILATGNLRPTLYSAGQRLLSDGRAIEEGAGDLVGPPFDRRREIFGVCGAACMLRRSLLTTLGGFDSRFFAFYEDVDLNARARILGWSFRYIPEAVVWHKGGVGWRRSPNATHLNARLVARNRLATAVKVMPMRSAPRVAWVEFGSLARSARRRTFTATLVGKLGVVPWVPALLRERRQLAKRGDRGRLREWFREEERWLGSWARSPVTPTVDPFRSP